MKKSNHKNQKNKSKSIVKYDRNNLKSEKYFKENKKSFNLNKTNFEEGLRAKRSCLSA